MKKGYITGEKHTFIQKARRFTALVLVCTMLVPSRASAVGMAINAVSSLFGEDDKQEEEIEKSDISGQYASEAEKLKQRLSQDASETNKKKLRLSQAKTLAIAMSEKIEAIDMQIDAKTAKMQSSVRALREKERSMGTLRWSPIFNIKLPEKPNEAEAFEFQFKPTQMQNEITALKHKITDIELDTNEKVSNTYIKIIAANAEVERLTERHKKLEKTVARLEIKVKDGSAALDVLESEGTYMEEDAEGNKVEISPRVLKARYRAAQDKLEKAEQALDNCTVELTNAMTTFEESKKKLSDIIGFDCTRNFNFEDAFITANLNRDNIDYLYNYALDDDPTVYEAQMANDEALLALRLNYELMKKQYADNIGIIEPYVQQALDGVKIPKKAFKNDYDTFLKKIDEKWQGSYKIWFIKIPKEWLKGEIDGIRFVEDDPYVLYSAALDYESARKELDNAQLELYNNVYEAYSNYASARKAYLEANKAYIKAEKILGVDEINYLMGELTEDEYEAEVDEFNSLKDDAASALSEFSQNLYSFDRTTCGGLSKFFEGTAQQSSEAIMLTPIIRTGCIYTLRPIIDSEEFLLSVDVPDDFYATSGVNITHFQLVCDGNIIGPTSKDSNGNTVYEKTPVGKTLRHLMLSTKDLGECAIRVFEGETFIDEVRIEPTVFSGPLNIKVGYEDGLNLHTLGTYDASDDVATDMLVLTLNLDQEQVRAEYESGQNAAYYRLCVAEDTYILSDRMIPVDRQFTYMSFLKSDLSNVYLELFDENGEKIGDAKFDTTRKEIYNDIDEETAEKIAEQKRIEAEQRAKEEAEAAKYAEIEEQKQAARELLSALGLATDERSLAYAMTHANELAYALELKQSAASLRKEHDKDVKKLEEMKNDPKTKPEDLRAMEDRVRITKEMPGIYENTLDEGIKHTLDEMEKYTQQYIKQLFTEYVSLHNEVKEAEENGESVKVREARMEEIATELKSFDEKTFNELKTAILKFEEEYKRLANYKFGENPTLYKDYATELAKYVEDLGKLATLAGNIKNYGFGDSFTERANRVFVIAYEKAKAEYQTNLEDEKSYNSPKTLTAEYKSKVNDNYACLNGIKELVKKVDGYSGEVEGTVKEASDLCTRVQKVDEERLAIISKIETEMQKPYLLITKLRTEYMEAYNKAYKEQREANSNLLKEKKKAVPDQGAIAVLQRILDNKTATTQCAKDAYDNYYKNMKSYKDTAFGYIDEIENVYHGKSGLARNTIQEHYDRSINTSKLLDGTSTDVADEEINDDSASDAKETYKKVMQEDATDIPWTEIKTMLHALGAEMKEKANGKILEVTIGKYNKILSTSTSLASNSELAALRRFLNSAHIDENSFTYAESQAKVKATYDAIIAGKTNVTWDDVIKMYEAAGVVVNKQGPFLNKYYTVDLIYNGNHLGGFRYEIGATTLSNNDLNSVKHIMDKAGIKF